jgi:hypothetical protein
MYEQRIAQQEAQFTERERYMKRNLEEEIDKLKESKAMLVKKKA